MTPIAAPPAASWRDRIVGHGTEAPSAIVPNDRNWRTHPKAQDAGEPASDDGAITHEFEETHAVTGLRCLSDPHRLRLTAGK